MAKKVATRKFKGGVSRNAAKQSRGAAYGHLNLPKGVRVFKEEPKSRMDIDILPYEVTSPVHLDRDDEYEIAVPGELWYKRPYYLHRSIGSGNDSIVCPSSVKQPCPICEYRAQLLKEGADWNDDTVKALRPALRNLYAVIPKNNKNYPEDIHIWDISQFLFQEKLNEEIQENEEYEAFPDLEDGFTLRIRFSEESFGAHKFAATSRIDFVDRDKPYTEAILEEVPSLDDILVVPSYKALSAMFYGDRSADEVDDEDDEDEPVPVKKTPVRKSKPEPEPEPEEEDEEEEDEENDGDLDEEEEEEEEPVPVKKAPVRKPAAPVKTPTKTPAKPAAKKAAANECPHGHTFGDDADGFDECSECDLWEDCMDAS